MEGRRGVGDEGRGSWEGGESDQLEGMDLGAEREGVVPVFLRDGEGERHAEGRAGGDFQREMRYIV